MWTFPSYTNLQTLLTISLNVYVCALVQVGRSSHQHMSYVADRVRTFSNARSSLLVASNKRPMKVNDVTAAKGRVSVLQSTCPVPTLPFPPPILPLWTSTLNAALDTGTYECLLSLTSRWHYVFGVRVAGSITFYNGGPRASLEYHFYSVSAAVCVSSLSRSLRRRRRRGTVLGSVFLSA